MHDKGPHSRRPWTQSPEPEDGLLGLTDDEILHRIAGLPDDHQQDAMLLQVVRSDRHFFVRQEAAKRLRDPSGLRDHSHDRHIGQILVRSMTRAEDIGYLQNLMAESRHVEVKKAAEAQLRILMREKG